MVGMAAPPAAGPPMPEKGPLVAVIGLGGVGSHCAHALVRAGVRRLRLVDFDRVSLSSLNRHAVATRCDVGMSKVVACGRHFQEIAPDISIDARDEMYTAAAAESLLGVGPDGDTPGLVIDCIDDVATKADLLAQCVSRGFRVLSALGSGAKSDPTQLCVAQGLRDIENDPLAAKLRKVFLTRSVDLSRVSFVYSSQKAQRSLLPLSEEQRQKPDEFGSVANFRIRVIPVLGTQPALSGVVLAAQALLELGVGRPYCPRPAALPRRPLVERWLDQLRKREASRGGVQGDVDVTVNEATFLVHEVWRSRSAVNTDLAVAGASGLRFTLARWELDRPVGPDNVVLATEEEADAQATGGGLADGVRDRIGKTLRRAGEALALPSLEALLAERSLKEEQGTLGHDFRAQVDVDGRNFVDSGSARPGRQEEAADEDAQREEAALAAEQLSRSSAFLGAEGHDRVRRSFVVVVGLGSVGCTAAALLARAGVRRLRLVDGAPIARSARHGLARSADVGSFKVEACRGALSDILPSSFIEACACHVKPANIAELLALEGEGGPPDLVLDCTGDVTTKATLLCRAVSHAIRMVTVVAPRGLMDPTRMSVAPLAEVHACPSVVLLRQLLTLAGVSSSALEGIDAVHSIEAGHWLQLPNPDAPGCSEALGAHASSCPSHRGPAGGFSSGLLPRFVLGLTAAAVALHRLAGEAPPQAPAPGALTVWKRLRRGLAQREQLEPQRSTLLPDVPAVGCITEHVWRGRSALSRSTLTEAATGLVLARWDHSRPWHFWNLVLLTEDEAAAHKAATAETGSLPRPLLDALRRGPDGAGQSEGLLGQQLRAHYVLQRLRQHLDAATTVCQPAMQRSQAQVQNTRVVVAGLGACNLARGALMAHSALAMLIAVTGGLILVAALGRTHHLEDVLRRSPWRPTGGPLHPTAASVLVSGIAGAAVAATSSALLGKFPERGGRCVRSGLPPRGEPSLGILSGFAGLVGFTPLVELTSLSHATGCRVLAKAEFLSPGGCQKDRVAQRIIEEAEASGFLRSGGTIVEGTSGNTGISLALAAAARGYRVHIVMPDDQAAEKMQLLQSFGAEVELVRPTSISNPEHYVNVARRRAEEFRGQPGGRGAVFADQFESPANFNAHYHGTGPELWSQCSGRLDSFVMSAGTGGTIAGVARFLKEVSQEVKVYLADVPGSSLYNKVARGVLYASEQAEQTVRRHRMDTIVEGIGIERLTANFARGLPAHNGGLPGIDAAVRVSDQEALDMAYYLLAHEGIFVGSSAAVNCAAAVKVARRRRPGAVIATVLCDGGQRHLSKFYNPTAWAEFGLSPPVRRDRGDLSFIC